MTTQTPALLMPPGGQRSMVIVAHPDDPESYCGGTAARLVEEGCEVHYLLVTRGDKGSDDPTMTPERLAVIREQEQREAAAVLGVQTVTVLDHADGEVEASLALRRELALMIRRWRPDVIFTFDPWQRYEIHPDHRATGQCTFDAVAAARGRMNFPEQLRDGITACRVGDVYFFNTDQANYWIDITDAIEKKLEARHCHVSQHLNDDYVIRTGRIAGAEHKMKYAEAFHHYRM
ncbi:MAG: PIG-L deacetylase family protein [Ktedonobacteraceae bacterium]